MNAVAAKTAKQQRGKPFKPGQSGNPDGRPLGSRHKATIAAETLLDGEAEALTRKAVEMALGGDGQAMRLCLERIVPPRRDRPLAFALPAMKTTADLAPAVAAIAQAVASGQVTLSEAADLSKIVASFGEAMKTIDLEERLSKLEKARESKSP